MTLNELRKVYIGKRINRESLSESISLQIEAENVSLVFCSGDEWVYSARIQLDGEDSLQIKEISRMTCKQLLSEDATSSVYRSVRVSKDDYDILDDALKECIESEKESKKAISNLTLESVMNAFPDKVIYLFVGARFLGVVNSRKIGMISNEEGRIKVKSFRFCREIRPFPIYVYLEDENIPDRWKA